MKTAKTQSLINEAQNFKAEMLKVEDLRIASATVSAREAIANVKAYDKAEEKYMSIYDKLVQDAAKNGWSISDFETNDLFDYETFDDDRDAN